MRVLEETSRQFLTGRPAYSCIGKPDVDPHPPRYSSPYLVRVSEAVAERGLPPHWAGIAPALKIDFENARVKCNFGETTENPVALPDYSLSFINSLVTANTNPRPVLHWNPETRQSVRDRIDRLSPERLVVGIHFRQEESSASPFGRAFEDVARQLLKDSRLQRCTFLVLGNHAPAGFTDHPQVLSAEDSGWSLAEQLIGSTETLFFIGEASGFCTAAIFSHAPYLIYKDPDQHAGTVDRDIGPGGNILFANDSQLFLRSTPNSENAATKVTALIAKSLVGSRLTWQGPGAERLP